LYTGYRDIYERGSRFHINPGWQLIEVPEYGSIDWLLTYSLRGKAPVLKQIVKKAGGNGTGIRLSADGKRLTYLSVVGYPMFSGNLGGFSTADLDAQPVTYPTHKIAGTQIFAYHPTLPLIAAGSKDAIVLFNRETGAIEADRLLLTSKGISGAQLEQIWFSPDGSGLILFCVSDAEGRYLRRVALRLSDAEKAIVARGVVSEKTVDRPSTPAPRVKLTDLESLKPPTAAAGERSPKQIGQEYMDAVVQIRCENASASGVAVGAGGYVLTSAHAIADDSDVTVLYQTHVRGSARTISTQATVVYRDDDSDLALLKIGPVTPLKTVVLAKPGDGKPIQAGETVTVIGHPGLGTQVLSHTLTTGVVSNAQRMIEGLEYIQTSAAVNPGNSGGPMFDSRGQVIGLVSLKAKLEGAAFAIPAHRLRKFLEMCAAGDQ
jgi:S1-C subfamily serine protease